MKTKALNMRMSERRLNKLRLYSAWRDKTMTQIIEDFIDSLPDKSLSDSVPASPDDSSHAPLRVRRGMNRESC